MIRQIWPTEREMDTPALEEMYGYPADPKWLAPLTNRSADGAVTDPSSATVKLSASAWRMAVRASVW